MGLLAVGTQHFRALEEKAGQGRSSLSVHFSSSTDEWETPQALFEELSWIFGGFTLDPCATRENAKCARYFTREENGLAKRWEGKVFLNPPYGRAIGNWAKLLSLRAKEHSSSVCFRRARIRAGGRNMRGMARSGSCVDA
jgi:hypothetical protein